ncbi:hypothetical protein O7602_22600 [Micromonospora sp. WMMD1128]|uniref:hypothetical protein n=1 Tax=Micromonospora sp. WMMD1128 TaxID=3015150 RepID=UPI00248AE340|nr:hypothetical protein [Micromonospora sp. WMMD1128]WBB77239.1 hypothetical protein O7602_22600 [Micromonospora sp. WMMD1128]
MIPGRGTVRVLIYLAGCLHDAVDDLHRLRHGGAGHVFDRFLGWARPTLRE